MATSTSVSPSATVAKADRDGVFGRVVGTPCAVGLTMRLGLAAWTLDGTAAARWSPIGGLEGAGQGTTGSASAGTDTADTLVASPTFGSFGESNGRFAAAIVVSRGQSTTAATATTETLSAKLI